MNTTYTKQSLALAYFPEDAGCPKNTVRHLMRWINGCPPLIEELKAAGYHATQKSFTARQVAIIYRHLGDPD